MKKDEKNSKKHINEEEKFVEYKGQTFNLDSLANVRKYQNDFNRKTYKSYAFRLHKEKDKKIIEHLKKKKELTPYLRSLILKDMK